MASIVNLNRERKKRDRARAKADAAQNRLKFGRPKAQRAEDDTTRQRGVEEVDRHRLEPASGDDAADPGVLTDGPEVPGEDPDETNRS